MCGKVILGILLVSAVFAISQENATSEPTSYEEIEAYKVYSAILPNEWPWSEANAKTLVTRTETEPYATCIAPDKESGKIVGSAIADYKKKNGRKWLLQRQFETAKPYEMVSSDEIDPFSGQRGRRAGRRSTSGILTLAVSSSFQPWVSTPRKRSLLCTRDTLAVRCAAVERSTSSRKSMGNGYRCG